MDRLPVCFTDFFPRVSGHFRWGDVMVPWDEYCSVIGYGPDEPPITTQIIINPNVKSIIFRKNIESYKTIIDDWIQ